MMSTYESGNNGWVSIYTSDHHDILNIILGYETKITVDEAK